MKNKSKSSKKYDWELYNDKVVIRLKRRTEREAETIKNLFNRLIKNSVIQFLPRK